MSVPRHLQRSENRLVFSMKRVACESVVADHSVVSRIGAIFLLFGLGKMIVKHDS